MAAVESSHPHHPPSLQTPGDRHRQVRPPSGGIRLPTPGVSEDRTTRATARSRDIVRPISRPTGMTGYSMEDVYVRRFWLAAIGPGAVADLLRLAAAAQSGRSLRRPTHLPTLLREGLISHCDGDLLIPDSVPKVPPSLVRRMPPALRREHQRLTAALHQPLTPREPS
jgi:hypothetical protein